MATLRKKVTGPEVAAAEATAPAPPPTIQLPATVTLAPAGVGYVHVVVGAGGTGARLAVQLVKLMTPSDVMIIFDGDIVEQRNLLRQHFVPPDVGRNKAEVLAERLSLAAPQGSRIIAIPEMLDYNKHKAVIGGAFGTTTERGYRSMVLYGCVDNQKSRLLLRRLHMTWNALGANPGMVNAYIDCGNAMRTGQVVLNLHEAWGKVVNGTGQAYDNCFVSFNGFDLMPGFLNQKDDEDGAQACAVRLDTQTLAANQWAATIAATMAAWVVDCLPFGVGGMMYSTLGSMKTVAFHSEVVVDGNMERAGRTLNRAHGGYLMGPHVKLRGMTTLL
jgi:hypothetical protein